MRALKIIIAALCFFVSPAMAAEQINNFDVAIVVEKDGDILVTEKINVTVEGREIRRGIFRDLPRYYLKNETRLPFDYDVKSVKRDGRKEKYKTEGINNALRIRIGDADKMLPHGVHEYEITYLVKNQIRYFTGFDELFWNATGAYWNFPITKARAVVQFPDGAKIQTENGYTGAQGATGKAYKYSVRNDAHVFETTKSLARREGMTFSLTLDKGVIDPPSAADARAQWWTIYGSLVVLGGTILGLFGFYLRAFEKVGRDPIKGPVFPRYEPPKGFSPVAVHHIYHRRLNDNKPFIATLIGMAVGGFITIGSKSKKKTVLTRLPDEDAKREMFPVEKVVLDRLLPNGGSKTVGGTYDAGFTKAYSEFLEFSGKNYGAPYFKWNAGFLVLGALISAAAIIVSVMMSVSWTYWHTTAITALIILNLLFAYLMPAPSPIGAEIRSHIEGFRLYLKTAEALQLNSATVAEGTFGEGPPPPMTTERYEKFLPYAIALGVEKPWTRHFEKLLPSEANDYDPHWSTFRGGNYNSVRGLNNALISSMNSGVSGSLPQSSSSSGSGGGGFSGGGGGGGGGGGW